MRSETTLKFRVPTGIKATLKKVSLVVTRENGFAKRTLLVKKIK